MNRDPMLDRIRLLTLAALLLMVVWHFLPDLQSWLSGRNAAPRAITPRGELANDEKNTIEIFEQASPSVVFITTKQRVVNYWTRNIQSIPQGSGSGFIWDQQGHVVTNNHVIEEAAEAIVRLDDGRSYPASLVGSSPEHDLAVLRIHVPMNAPPAVPVGQSGDLKVGQKVFAIGNPFGLDHTLTTGVVSALDRSLTEENGAVIEHLIQTDAAINPGNSGGPLLDSAGRLIGINTAIYSPSGAYAGIGFAVPVDTVNKVVPQLIKNGKYRRPNLGISIDQGVNKALLTELGINGVAIIQVAPGSSADKAGLVGAEIDRSGRVLLGDIIVGVNDQPVTDVETLLNILDDCRVGDKVQLQLIRQQQKVSVDVLLQ